MKKTTLTFMLTLIGCSYDFTPLKQPPVEIKVSSASEELTKNLYSLVNHCYDFNENTMHHKRDSCGIIIPFTKQTDDTISGKGEDDAYNPTSIPSSEGFMTITHRFYSSPKIILDGVVISGQNMQDCPDKYCLNFVVSHIQSIDSRRRNETPNRSRAAGYLR